jgi:hypothetical protein
VTLNYVTLTLDLYDGQGSPVTTGTAFFTPSVQLTDSGVELVPQVPVRVVFHARGLPTVSLLATDNTAPLPNGWGWSVSFSGVPGNPPPFTFFLPYSAGASQFLSAQAPVSNAVTMQAYMPLPSGTATAGAVPVATGSGSGSAWVQSLEAYNVLNPAYSGGADPTGAVLSTAAFAACVTAAHAAKMPVTIPAGSYKIDATLNWMLPGLQVITAGAQNTVINMATANTPILQVAGEGQRIGGLTLRYPSQQTSGQTSAIGVEFGDNTVGSCFLSIFEDLRVYQAAKGLATNPSASSSSGLFSCYFGNVEVFGYSISAIDINGGNGVGAGNTGCVFDNTYIHNNFSGTPVISAAWPVILRNWSEVVFNELNIEKCIIPSPALQFAECGNVVINSMHFEGIQAGGTNLAVIGVGSQTGSVVINGLSVRFSTFTGSSSNAIIQFTAGSGQSVQVNGFNMPTADGGNQTSQLALVDFNSIPNATVTVNGINPLGPLYAVNQINATTGDQLVIQDGAQLTYDPSLAWTTFASGGAPNGLNNTSGSNTAPTAGTWYYCDLFVPFTATITGLIAAPGSVGGTDKWIVAVWPAAGGTVLANSATAGITAPAANTAAKFAFTAPVSLPGPAVYKVAIQSNGTTARLLNFANAVEGFVTGTQAGSFGTIPTLTPGGSYTQNAGPMVKTY